MEALKTMIPQKLLAVLERAGISTPSQILHLSECELTKLSKLNLVDIQMAKKVVASYYCPKIINGVDLRKIKDKRVPIGVSNLDRIMLGGFRCGAITEIYGESGSGKSQLCLQAALNCWERGAIYICTEDKFPVKRFNQMKESLKNYNSQVDYGKNVYVEYVTDADELLSCIRVRLPQLLKSHQADIVIIDSVAAPFRCESTNYMQRADNLQDLSMLLLGLAQERELAVLCVNQVTASMEQDDVLPSLGLAWSNMINTRLYIKKSDRYTSHRNSKDMLVVRELSVVFAPELPSSKINFLVTTNGVEDLM